MDDRRIKWSSKYPSDKLLIAISFSKCCWQIFISSSVTRSYTDMIELMVFCWQFFSAYIMYSPSWNDSTFSGWALKLNGKAITILYFLKQALEDITLMLKSDHAHQIDNWSDKQFDGDTAIPQCICHVQFLLKWLHILQTCSQIHQ